MEQTENLCGLRQATTARLLQAWVHSDIANGSRTSEVRSASHENHHNVHLFNLHQDAIDCEHSLVLHPRITVEWYKHCCFIDALRFLGAKVRYTRDGPFHVLSHGIRTLGRNDNIWDFIHECKHHHLVIRRVSIVPLRLLAKALLAYYMTQLDALVNASSFGRMVVAWQQHAYAFGQSSPPSHIVRYTLARRVKGC